MKMPEALFPDPETSSMAGIIICWAEIHLSSMNTSPNRRISKCEASRESIFFVKIT